VIFVCTGTRVNNKSFATHFSDLLDDEGRIKVNAHFQVEGFDNVFALGDCCNMEQKMAYFAAKHGSVVSRNIQILQANDTGNKNKPLVSYTRTYISLFFSLFLFFLSLSLSLSLFLSLFLSLSLIHNTHKNKIKQQPEFIR